MTGEPRHFCPLTALGHIPARSRCRLVPHVLPPSQTETLPAGPVSIAFFGNQPTAGRGYYFGNDTQKPLETHLLPPSSTQKSKNCSFISRPDAKSCGSTGGYFLTRSKAIFSMNHLKGLHFNRSRSSSCLLMSPASWKELRNPDVYFIPSSIPHPCLCSLNRASSCKHTPCTRPSKSRLHDDSSVEEN